MDCIYTASEVETSTFTEFLIFTCTITVELVVNKSIFHMKYGTTFVSLFTVDTYAKMCMYWERIALTYLQHMSFSY